MNDEDFKVINSMEQYGGDFVKCLARCFMHADPNNFKKLKETFKDYWEDYKKFNPKKK